MYQVTKNLTLDCFMYKEFPAVASAGKVNNCSICSDVMQGGTAGCYTGTKECSADLFKMPHQGHLKLCSEQA